jgi:hypothetical protein
MLFNILRHSLFSHGDCCCLFLLRQFIESLIICLAKVCIHLVRRNRNDVLVVSILNLLVFVKSKLSIVKCLSCLAYLKVLSILLSLLLLSIHLDLLSLLLNHLFKGSVLAFIDLVSLLQFSLILFIVHSCCI